MSKLIPTYIEQALRIEVLERAVIASEGDVERLERELAEAQKDAERYRWLRDDERGRSLSVSSLEWKNNAELSDAAIDAAMKEVK